MTKTLTDEPNHDHPEAFCLMKYRADDGSVEELIWNSRDGVTPFVITMQNGKPGTHINWHEDVYAPGHQLKPGERYFADLTPERALKYAQRNIDNWREAGYDVDVAGLDPQALADGYLVDGAPDILTFE